jgi:Protein of unknown function (DUF2800)
VKHSPLGASGAERWMHCPGSITLLKSLDTRETTDEPSYRQDGTTAHSGALACLEQGLDAWEIMDQEFEGHPFTAALAKGVQVYLDAVRADIDSNSLTYFETHISDPAVHPDFYGTTDCCVVNGSTMIVSDYKNGAGVSVYAEENPQIMYYAYGMLRHLGSLNTIEIDKVLLRIVQPNDFNPEGPIREWWTTRDFIVAWAEHELVPAMRRTETDTSLEIGSHCRFCPAKLVCPAMRGLFGAFADADASAVKSCNDAELGRLCVMTEVVAMMSKAVKDETYQRLISGVSMAEAKLIEKKADRVFKPGAELRFKEQFAERAYSTPELLSPAQMEKLGPDAKKLVAEWAYKPNTGYTVALASARGTAVKVTPAVSAAFATAVANMEE